MNSSYQSLTICKTAKQHDGPVLVIAPNISLISQLEQELQFFAGDANLTILTFPDWETLPYDHFSPHQDIISQRLLTLYKLLSLKKGIVLVSINTIMHRIAPRDYIAKHSFILHVHEDLAPEQLAEDLTNKNYHRVNQVIQHGEFAVRGSIIDVFPMGSALPFRIDFFDDSVDSIREFDPETQKSSQTLDEIMLLPAREYPLNKQGITHFQQNWPNFFRRELSNCPLYQNIMSGISFPGIEYYLPLFFGQTRTLFNYLPKNSLIIKIGELNQPAEIFWQEINARYDQLGHDITHPILPPKEMFIPANELFGYQKQFFQIKIEQKPSNLPDLTIDSKAKQPLEKLQKFLQKSKQRVLFCTESAGRREALLGLLNHIDIHPDICRLWHEFLGNKNPLSICVSPLTAGFKLEDIIVITESELFSRQIMQRRLRAPTEQDTETVVRDLTELHVGDPVVHIDHGIGRYLGLQKLTAGGQTAEYLTIEYADDAKLYIPISSLHLIGRYLGTSPENAPISKLGSKQWGKAKRKAIEKIRDVAAELLDIYARRAAKTGHKFSIPEDQYKIFAGSFPYEETPDQQTAITATLNDMALPICMDRLICGDVGFGKTEVAMRSAFIAAQNSKQTAILVPTTLLAQQHYDNFRDRFAEWPINVVMLSRFNSPQQQKTIIEQIKAGKADIIIGTHKLLQQDVKFKNLGLLVIDEEHRFGVKQKEKIKSLRANIDILTLTATPIPRTLNMALSGIRDLSIIATPPEKRRAIKTFVQKYNKHIIREAILREVFRGGQVYFLHNDIATIEKTAHELQNLIPEIKIEIAHGQMRERRLEQIMSNFYHARFNVLVCTTIIESGIDVPTANTIIINRADNFGLAQLHQLRGRVGRSHHQAYAYLLIPPEKSISKDAQKRLDAVSAMEDLGSGFILATHDLEIRGAGEILGEDQSGQIQAIGFNLYMDFLEQAVKTLKSGKNLDLEKPLYHGLVIELQIPALIPDEYVYDVNTRLTLYKRIASAKNRADLHELQVELIDRFGLLPGATKNLFAIANLKLKAEPLGIQKIKSGITDGYIEFADKPNIEPQTIIQLIQKYPDIYKLTGSGRLNFIYQDKSSEKRIMQISELIDKLMT